MAVGLEVYELHLEGHVTDFAEFDRAEPFLRIRIGAVFVDIPEHRLPVFLGGIGQVMHRPKTNGAK